MSLLDPAAAPAGAVQVMVVGFWVWVRSGSGQVAVVEVLRVAAVVVVVVVAGAALAGVAVVEVLLASPAISALRRTRSESCTTIGAARSALAAFLVLVLWAPGHAVACT